MYAESRTSDDLAPLFRSISTKRKHGVLNVVGEECTLEISFANGKIVSCDRVGESKAVKLCERLEDAGVLQRGFTEAVFVEDRDIEQLHDLLVGKKRVDPNAFTRALHSYEVDLLHQLRTLRIITTEFEPGIIDTEPAFHLSISPGQLLLDLVELAEEHDRFASVFGDILDENTIIQKSSKDYSGSSGLMGEMWRICPQQCAVRDLMQKVLASQYEICSTLLALHDQRFIKVKRGIVAGETQVEESRSVGVVEGTTTSETKHPAGESAESRDLLERSDFLAKLDEEFGDEAFDLFSDDESDVQTSVDEGEELPEDFRDAYKENVTEVVSAESVTAIPESSDLFEVASPPEVMPVAVDHPAPLPEVDASVPKLSEWLFRSNYFLREERGLSIASTVVTILVLIVVGMVLPGEVERLFEAIGAFSDHYARLRGGLGF